MMKKFFYYSSIATTLLVGTLSLSGFADESSNGTTPDPTEQSDPPNTTNPFILKTTHGSLGTYLTDSEGKSLYVFDLDSSGKSNCTGECTKVWPPVEAPFNQHVQAEGGVKSNLLGMITRSDGIKQLTYNGMPLYYYSKDQKPGETNGQGISGFGGKWSLVEPNGNKITSSSH